MIKIFLDSSNCKVVGWQKGNKMYKCFRNDDGEMIIYNLIVTDLTRLSFKSPIISDNLADINKWLKKEKFEIVEY